VRITLFRGSIAAALLLAAIPGAAQQIQLNTVVSGLNSPVFVGHAGDGSNRLFIVEQGGIIKVLQPGESTPTIFLNITSSVLSGGERGLLGLAFHPQYSLNRRFFVFYTQPGDGALAIAEYAASPSNPNMALPTEQRRILTIPHASFANHNGGMIAFGDDTFLYIGVGDGGSSYDPDNNAQNINSLLGKLLRINIDAGAQAYTSPSDNPFVNVDGRDEIFAYGFRNPWRFSFDRSDGTTLWVGDVGQGAREEVDTPVINGGNYGWRVFEGTLCTNRGPAPCVRTNYIDPRFEYDHSTNGRCSLTGGYVYRGSGGALPTGTYIFGDYCSGEVFAWNGSSQNVLLDTTMNISSFGEDEAGELYVVNLGGSVSKIVGSTPPPPPTCTFSVNPTRATFAQPGGPGSVTVTASDSSCVWTAVSNASWIVVSGPASRMGSGVVNYSVAAYTGKPKKRNGNMTIAGSSVQVSQTK
jgi:glucose/arabinose dehydrogenase